MALVSRVVIPLRCPSCGASGLAQGVENNAPFDLGWGFSIQVWPQGFQLAKGAVVGTNLMVRCETCEQAFALPKRTSPR